MPRLSDSMEEGTILKWLVAPGDAVSRGQELVEIETDKATMTYEADADGVLEIVAAEGDTLPIGAVIARIGGAGGVPGSSGAEPAGEAGDGAGGSPAGPPNDSVAGRGVPAGGSPAPSPPDAPAPVAAAPVAPAPPPPAAPAAPPSPDATEPASAPASGERVKASPLARRVARERGVEISGLTGTGPGGRVVRADVEAAVGGPAAAPGAASPVAGGAGTAKGQVTVQEPTRAQQVVARRMAESRATIPDFTLTTEVAMDAALALRAQLKEVSGDDAPSYNDMVVKAAALALREFPRANGSYRDGRFELHSRVNVGVAVAAEDALVVPTVFDADTRSLGDVARATRALAERVRSGEVTPPELSGGTFTVSNLGMFGVTSFTAVINPPQAAILAVGALAEQPVVRDGAVTAGHVMPLTLSCDHRILYGAEAARFLARVRELLEKPVALLL